MAGTHKPFMRTHWVTLVTLVAFVALFFGVRWIVKTQRSPGSITVVEAQGMDMAAMKAPPGVQPVESEAASYRQIGGSQSFPATVVAFSDEEVSARVPGRVLSIAYPGDNVTAGQVVARIDAGEYLAQAGQARFAADSSTDRVAVTTRDVERRNALKTQALGGVEASNAARIRAEADRAVALAEAGQMESEADAKRAVIRDREAEAVYTEQTVRRKQKLYEAGVVSRSDYEAAQAGRDSALARVDTARADAVAAAQSANAAKARVTAAEGEIKQAQAQARVSHSAVTAADKDIEMAKAELGSSRANARASTSGANSAGIIASYTQLRALDDSMVSERIVSPGSVVTAGQKLLMLHVVREVRIQAQLPQALSALVSVGTPVAVRYGKLVLSAKLTSIFPTADPATRTFVAEALLPNPGHKLLPGGFATMSVETSASQRRLAVRSSAIQSDASGDRFVWIISELSNGQKTDWTCPMHTQVSEPGPGRCPICKMELVPRTRGGTLVAARRTVTVGALDGTFTAVASGVRLGEQVISAGFETLIEGTHVKVTAPEVAQHEPTPESEPTGAKSNSERLKTASRSKPPARHTVKAAQRHKPVKQLYTCPMHPEVIRDHPGKCPKCGMELVRTKAAK